MVEGVGTVGVSVAVLEDDSEKVPVRPAVVEETEMGAMVELV